MTATVLDMPDLILTSLTVDVLEPSSPRYYWTIKNIGTAPANLDGPTAADYDNVSVQAFFSNDTVSGNADDVPAGGSVIGVSPLGNLAPGDSISGTSSVGLGAYTDICAFTYLLLMVDWGGSVQESDETNNILAAPIDHSPCTGDRPDLILTSLTVDVHAASGPTYYWTIKNIGTVPANLDGPTGEEYDNFSLLAYLSNDTVFDNADDVAAGGSIIGVSPLGNLAPGDSISGSFPVGRAGDIDICGFTYLVLLADWGQRVFELDETNNTLAAVIDCGSGVGDVPDLILTSLTVVVLPESFVSYAWTIKNIGAVPANLDGWTDSENDNVSVLALLSNDTIFDNAGDVGVGGGMIGLSPLGNLAPGDSISGSSSVGPFADPCAYTYLVLMVDHEYSVYESNETNNTLAAVIDCTPVSLSSFTLSRSEEAVEVRWTFRQGESGGEFRLSAERGEDRWDVPVRPQPGTEFVAFDRSPHLIDGGDIVYQLFYRGPGEAWLMLAEQTIALSTAREPTRLWSLYPNPARARVAIPFSSGRGGHARLTVHDVTGREVARVFEGLLRPGSGQWNWSGEDARGIKLPAGVYVVRLATEQGVQARKVVLVE